MTTRPSQGRPLTAKQAAFVREYLVDLNATQAAIRAGYSAKTVRTAGPRMLRFVGVRDAIEKAQAKRAMRVDVTQDWIVNGIRETVERCRQAVPVRDSEGLPTGEWRFEPTAALRGFELLGKHLGMFRERLSLENPDGSALVEGSALSAMAAIIAAGAGSVATREASA